MKANSYLIFELGNELFASHVKNVLKILEMQKITEVPKAPSYMKGVINLWGNVLPIIDTRQKFGMTAVEYTSKTCILVLSIKIDDEKTDIGAIVDSVQEVLEYDPENIKPSPSLGSQFKSEFIEGVMKINDKFIMVLNMDKVFSTDEIIELKEKATDKQDDNKENEQSENNKNNNK